MSVEDFSLKTQGFSLLVIAVAAILTFSVKATVAGIDIGTVGLAAGLWLTATGRGSAEQSM
jgi:hypothetical protein